MALRMGQPTLSHELLRAARQQAGLTQEGAAREAKTTLSTLKRAERGTGAPRIEVLARLAQVYGTTIDAFVLWTNGCEEDDEAAA